MKTIKKQIALLAAAALPFFIAACSSNVLGIDVPSRGSGVPSIRTVDLWMDQTPLRYQDGGVLETSDGGAAEVAISVSIVDHTNTGPTPAGPLTVQYGDAPVVASFASGGVAVLIPPKDISGDPTDATVAKRRNRYRLRLKMTHTMTDNSTCEVTNPAYPQRWQVTLDSAIPTRFCVVSSAPTAPPCAGTPAVITAGPRATLTVMQLKGGAQMPQIQDVPECNDVLGDNPIPL